MFSGLARASSSRYFPAVLVLCIFVLYAGIFVSLLAVAHAKGTSTAQFISGEGDAQGYAVLAHSLADTGRFFTPESPTLSQFRTPGYPLFFAVLAGIFGSDLAVPLAQMFLVGLSALCIIALGERFRSYAIGLTAAALYVLDPLTLMQSFVTMTETLFIFLLLAATLMLTQERLTRSSVFAGGLLLGIGILVRPLGLYLVPVFLLWTICNEWRAWRALSEHVALLLIGVLLVCAPWMLHNYRSFGHFTLSTAGPYDMLLYNIPEHIQHVSGTPVEATQGTIYRELGVAGLPDPREPLMGFSYMDTESHMVAQYLSQHLAGYTIYHIASTLPFFFGSDVSNAQHILAVQGLAHEPQSVNHSYLLFHGRFREFFSTMIAEVPELLERLVWLVLLFSACGAVLYALLMRSKSALLGLLFLALIGAQALLAGPQSQPRYRMPATPFILVLGLSGLGMAASYGIRTLPGTRD